MPNVSDRIAQEINTLKNEMTHIDPFDLSNVTILPNNVVTQLKNPNFPDKRVVSVSNVITDQFPDNTSIFIKPSTNIAYYKTSLGWIEIGKLMTQNNETHQSIAAGYNHTVFLLADGTCKAVGSNDYRQLGDGTLVDKSTPVSVLNVSNCVSISCGSNHTIFLLADGTCKSVGQNSNGQLGDGTTVDKSTPVVVLNVSNCIGVSCGFRHTQYSC